MSLLGLLCGSLAFGQGKVDPTLVGRVRTNAFDFIRVGTNTMEYQDEVPASRMWLSAQHIFDSIDHTLQDFSICSTNWVYLDPTQETSQATFDWIDTYMGINSTNWVYLDPTQETSQATFDWIDTYMGINSTNWVFLDPTQETSQATFDFIDLNVPRVADGVDTIGFTVGTNATLYGLKGQGINGFERYWDTNLLSDVWREKSSVATVQSWMTTNTGSKYVWFTEAGSGQPVYFPYVDSGEIGCWNVEWGDSLTVSDYGGEAYGVQINEPGMYIVEATINTRDTSSTTNYAGSSNVFGKLIIEYQLRENKQIVPGAGWAATNTKYTTWYSKMGSAYFSSTNTMDPLMTEPFGRMRQASCVVLKSSAADLPVRYVIYASAYNNTLVPGSNVFVRHTVDIMSMSAYRVSTYVPVGNDILY